MKILVEKEDLQEALNAANDLKFAPYKAARILENILSQKSEEFILKSNNRNPILTDIDLEDLMGKRMYLVTHRIYKPLGLFDSLEKAKKDGIERLNFNKCMRPEDAVIFEIPLNFLNQSYNFINPSRYSDEKLLYQVYITKDGEWGANCLGYPSGFNKYNNTELKEYYRDNLICTGYNYLHIEEVIDFSSEEAIKKIKRKMIKIGDYLE